MKRGIAAVTVLAMVLALMGTVLSAFAQGTVPASGTAEGAAGGMAEGAGDAVYAELSYGDDGEEVIRLQTKLTKLCYYTGNISGRYREGTRAAIRKFQKDFGLKETGAADSDTQKLLYETNYRPLQYGSSGEDVKALQTRLTELGYYHGKISGSYLEGSTSAIGAFQRKTGLESTGKADVETQEALFDQNALPKNAPTAAPAAANPVETPFAVPDGAQDAQAMGAADFQSGGEATPMPTEKYTKKLNRGATGANVKKVQQRLKDLGFFDGPISGNYMSQTQAAVKSFQEYNGLVVDGVTGEDTWNAMFNSPDVVNASATPRPAPKPDYAITVDVNNQVVNVYGLDDQNEHTVLVRQMLCSTGLKATPSDVGEWTLSGRTARWCYFPKWGSHAQYWTKINSSIAFHSVIYNTVNTMDLSVKSYKALGSRASHGCIRLLVSDAKWIYDNVGKGTVVTITEDLPLDPELTESLKPAPLNYKNMLPQETPQPTAPPAYVSGGTPPQPFQTLKKGSQGEDVYWLQCKLSELGYYTGTITGGYYAGTVEAVKAFQRDNGLAVDGMAGKATQEKLYEKELNPAPKAVPTPEGAAPAATPAPIQSAPVPVATPAASVTGDGTVG